MNSSDAAFGSPMKERDGELRQHGPKSRMKIRPHISLYVFTILLAVLTTSAKADADAFWGPWCTDDGDHILDIASDSLSLVPQTYCALPEPFPTSGSFDAQLACTTSLFLGGDGSETHQVNVLTTVRLTPTDEGGLTVQLNSGPTTELVHCHTVWPL